MSDERHPKTEPSDTPIYNITIKGHLGDEWAHWFGDATITLNDDGDTLLTCALIDQAALYGVLRKVRDLGMPLLEVTQVRSERNTGENS